MPVNNNSTKNMPLLTESDYTWRIEATEVLRPAAPKSLGMWFWIKRVSPAAPFTAKMFVGFCAGRLFNR